MNNEKKQKITDNPVVWVCITLAFIVFWSILDIRSYHDNKTQIDSASLILQLDDIREYIDSTTAPKMMYPNSDKEMISVDYTGDNFPSKEEVVIAIAEIYARYGQVFTGEYTYLNERFQRYDWYNEAVKQSGGDCFDFYDLTFIEQQNIIMLTMVYDNYDELKDITKMEG